MTRTLSGPWDRFFATSTSHNHLHCANGLNNVLKHIVWAYGMFFCIFCIFFIHFFCLVFHPQPRTHDPMMPTIYCCVNSPNDALDMSFGPGTQQCLQPTIMSMAQTTPQNVLFGPMVCFLLLFLFYLFIWFIFLFIFFLCFFLFISSSPVHHVFYR